MSNRGIALTLAALILAVAVLSTYIHRMEALCCARDIQRVELRLVRICRISENFEGALRYNMLKGLYCSGKPIQSRKDIGRMYAETAEGLAKLFSETYNLSLIVNKISVEGPFELGSMATDYRGVKGYTPRSTCYSVTVSYEINDSYASLSSTASFMLCHPARYFTFKRAVEELRRALEGVELNSSLILSIAERSVHEMLRGFKVSLRVMERSLYGRSAIILRVEAADVETLDEYMWRCAIPIFTEEIVITNP